MVGQILGTPGNLPDVYRQIEIKTHLLPRLLGVAQDENKKKGKAPILSKNKARFGYCNKIYKLSKIQQKPY